MKFKFLLPLLCGLAVLASGQRAVSSAEDFVVEKDTAMPMRDGVILRADELRPCAEGAFAVLVYRTPYGKEPALEDYTTFRRAVEHGYVRDEQHNHAETRRTFAPAKPD